MKNIAWASPLGAVALGVLVACTVETVTPPPTGNTPPASTAPEDEPPIVDGGNTTDSGSKSDAGKRDSGSPNADAGCTPVTYYKDGDGDGYGDPNVTQSACVKPSGFVDTKTDCDDTKAAVNPRAVEYCDQVDNNCDGQVNGSAAEAAACTGFVGSYTGSYAMVTEEKIGATVVNSVRCSGTSVITIDLGASKVIRGTMTCAYAGRLGDFASSQPATIEANVAPDGQVVGTISHAFTGSPANARTFNIKGTLGAGGLVINDVSNSWRPNAMSAVAWTLQLSVNATK
jgi:hypothetical protein